MDKVREENAVVRLRQGIITAKLGVNGLRRTHVAVRRSSIVSFSFVALLMVASQFAVVTPSNAASNVGTIDVKAIIAGDYATNNADNADLNYAQQATHEQGSALVIDDEAFRAAKLSGYKTLDGPRYFPFYGTVTGSSAPVQTTYPQRFAVIMKQSSPPGTPSADRICPGSGGILVEQKNSASSPWRVSLEPYLAKLSSAPTLLTTSSSNGNFAADSYALNLSTLPHTLVVALNTRGRTGNGGYLLPASVFAYGHCGALGMEDPRREVGSYHGLLQSFSASTITPSDVTAYETKGGGALAVFTVREQVVERPALANQYVIWSHGATAWWSLLPAGHYSTVSWTMDQEVAIYVPSATSSQKARIVGAYNGVISVTGKSLG